MEVFSVKNKNKNVEKIDQKKKDIILKVKINKFDLNMNTGSEVKIIPKISGNTLKTQIYDFVNLMGRS